MAHVCVFLCAIECNALFLLSPKYMMGSFNTWYEVKGHLRSWDVNQTYCKHKMWMSCALVYGCNVVSTTISIYGLWAQCFRSQFKLACPSKFDFQLRLACIIIAMTIHKLVMSTEKGNFPPVINIFFTCIYSFYTDQLHTGTHLSGYHLLLCGICLHDDASI